MAALTSEDALPEGLAPGSLDVTSQEALPEGLAPGALDVTSPERSDPDNELPEGLVLDDQSAGNDLASDPPEGLATSPELTLGHEVIHSRGYRVVRLVGEGGMGRVYEAYDPRLERKVAFKILKPEVPEVERRRFRREAIFGARFCHPSVARVYDMGLLRVAGDELEWFVMEFLDGTDMERVIEKAVERDQPPPLLSVLDVFRQALAGLQYVHDCGVIHRDVKPANIFVSRDPNTNYVTTKLLDYGIALDIDAAATPEGVLCGDPRYMAPEQTRVDLPLDPRADIYAAGLSLYEIAARRHPYEDLIDGPLYQMLGAHRSWELPPLGPQLPASWPHSAGARFEAIIRRACEKSADARYERADEMARELAELKDQL